MFGISKHISKHWNENCRQRMLLGTVLLQIDLTWRPMCACIFRERLQKTSIRDGLQAGSDVEILLPSLLVIIRWLLS